MPIHIQKELKINPNATFNMFNMYGQIQLEYLYSVKDIYVWWLLFKPLPRMSTKIPYGSDYILLQIS